MYLQDRMLKLNIVTLLNLKIIILKSACFLLCHTNDTYIDKLNVEGM